MEHLLGARTCISIEILLTKKKKTKSLAGGMAVSGEQVDMKTE